jgi:hypothetical protein
VTDEKSAPQTTTKKRSTERAGRASAVDHGQTAVARQAGDLLLGVDDFFSMIRKAGGAEWERSRI